MEEEQMVENANQLKHSENHQGNDFWEEPQIIYDFRNPFCFIFRWSTRASQKNHIPICEKMGFDDLTWSKQCSTLSKSKEQMENGKM